MILASPSSWEDIDNSAATGTAPWRLPVITEDELIEPDGENAALMAADRTELAEIWPDKETGLSVSPLIVLTALMEPINLRVLTADAVRLDADAKEPVTGTEL